MPLFCQIPNGSGLLELGEEGGEGGAGEDQPLQGFCSVVGHRWLPSDCQLGTAGKFLLPCGSSGCKFGIAVGAGQRLEETPPPELQIHLSHRV